MRYQSYVTAGGSSMDNSDFNSKSKKTSTNQDRSKRLVEKTDVERVVTMSDLHGWYGPFLELLEKSEIIVRILEDKEDAILEKNVFRVGDDDDYYRYVGGNATIVLVGDCIDGCLGTRKIIDLIINLENQSRMAGGDVITLVGNHEQQLLQTSYRGSDFEDFSPYGLNEIFDFKEWLKNLPLVAIVNDVLFVHAGITNRVLKKVDKGKHKNECFIDAFRRILENGVYTDLTTVGGNWGYEGGTLRDILEKTGTNYVVVGHNSTYGKSSNEIGLVGPEIGGGRRVFAVATDIADYEGASDRKNTGGALSLRWMEGGIEAEYIYRSHNNQKFNLPNTFKSK